METKRFYSNGKLLITSEYLVLDGGQSLALPTKKGQDLIVVSGKDREIKWTSRDHDGSVWFEGSFSFEEICTPEYVEKEDSIRSRLLEILHEAWLKNPEMLDAEGYEIETNLTFPRNWGLGTSSTLINNIATWLGIDPYQLLRDSFGGSGYDIACAKHDSPILYRLENGNPVVEKVGFNPEFASRIYFVYLNKKQSSKAAIQSYYHNRVEHLDKRICEADKITQKMLSAQTLADFAHQMEKHENLISGILEMQTVKEALFPDFTGAVKSLGGWGGDFVMVASKDDPSEYFRAKGFGTVVPFREMIL